LPAVITTSQPPPLALSGGEVRHTQMTLPSKGGSVFLDVYAPADSAPPIPGERVGLVIIPGVGDNRDVPDLINLSTTLARGGFVVMNLTTPTLISFNLSPQDADGVVQAVQALQHWPGVGRNRVGILGLSAGSALACLAAADPRIQHELAFITLFGGYFDATTVVRDVGRRALDVDGRLVPWQPYYVPINVLANAVAPSLPPADAERIVNALGPGGTAQGDGAVPLSDSTLQQMSPGAVAVYHLLVGDQPDRVADNMAALPPASHELLDSVSPSSVIDRITTHVYLLHDTSDQFVPFTESRDFDAALRRLGRKHDFVEFSIFAHVEVRSGVGIGPLVADGSRLFGILYSLLLRAS
jgi:dienelactone hydrolase